jgi:HprK-related kinase A
MGFCVVNIRTTFASVAQGIHLLYADYPLEAEDSFADFHVSVEAPRNLRRWFAPQVLFRFDRYLPSKPLPAAQAFPLLEWGLNWCFSTQYHRHLVIHGAVVEKNGRALILPAPPGSGKSTLCAALVARGWRLLSDELALIKFDNLRVAPMCRPLSLKNESLQIIQDLDPGAVFGAPAHDTAKGTVGHMRAPLASVRHSQEDAMPAWVVFPKYQAGASTQLSPMPKAEAFMQIAENTFNYSMLGLQGFETIGQLVDHCDCKRFTYSKLNEAIALFQALSAA